MNDTIEIPLSKGYVALVDAEDGYLAELKWHTHVDPVGNPYAVRRERVKGEGRRIHRRMHREIANPPDDMFVDHLNGNTLDNRRANLRSVTHAENHRNQSSKSTAKSGYLGVVCIPERKRFRATIGVNGVLLTGPARKTPAVAEIDRLVMEYEHYGIQPRRAERFRAVGFLV